MIFLTPNPNHSIKEQASADELEAPSFQRDLQAVINLYSNAEVGSTFTCSSLVDQDGNEYEQVGLRADAVFKRDGEVWVAGGGFALNATRVLAMWEPLLIK